MDTTKILTYECQGHTRTLAVFSFTVPREAQESYAMDEAQSRGEDFDKFVGDKLETIVYPMGERDGYKATYRIETVPQIV